MKKGIQRTVLVYALFVLLWFVANRLVQDIAWPLAVLDKFAEYFLAASIPVFLLALMSFNLKTVIAGLIPVLITGYFYLPLLIPNKNSHNTDSSQALRIATFNIWNHNIVVV